MMTRRPLAEDLRVRQQHEPELAPDEPAPRGRDGEEELRFARKSRLLQDACLDPTEQVLRAQGLAAVRKRHDDAVPGADEGGELVLGLGEPARGEGRALRLERE